MKKFVINFVISLIIYLVVNFLSLIVGFRFYPDDYLMLYWRFFGFNITTVVIIFHMIIVAVLYFLIGTKLNLLGKHLLNYLSVCGSFIVACIFLLTFYSAMVFNASFLWLLFLVRNNAGFFIMSTIVATFPSVLTWFGMLYKSKKLMCKNS